MLLETKIVHFYVEWVQQSEATAVAYYASTF